MQGAREPGEWSEPRARRASTRRALRGASLIEMMTVVVLLSLMAAVAAPNMFPLVQKTRLGGEAEAVASFLFAVRARAMADGRCYRVQVTAGGKRITTERRNSGDCVDLTKDGWTPSPLLMIAETAITYRLADPTDVVTKSAANDLLVFRPNGRLYGDGDLDASDDRARIVVDNSNVAESRSVIVNGTGRVCVIPSTALLPPAMTPATAANDCDRHIP
jgi:Tfp pilus assembly protein FimT